jgi:CheY-like chemotaxis protein/two-component sensor histidine kinase
MARLSEGKVELRREQVALAQIVDDAIEISMPLIDAGRHTIERRLPAAPVTLYVDRHRIAQVLSNLVNNAAKYTPAGGHLTLSARIEDGALVLAVGDNGIGIDAAMLPLVFDMYAQAHRHEGLGQGGLGVGLNLVRKLVELHGGSVAVHSEGAGQGSCFTVSLPLEAVIDGHDAAVAPAPALAQREAAGALRVLVVDDNLDAAEMLGALLEMRGHAVRIVHDGAACLRAAAAFLPQVVFLDIGLPDRSGFEVAPDLRRLAGMADVSLIALTGWGAEEDRRRSGSAGFNGHLTKPADLASVEAVLREVTAGGRPQGAPAAAAGRHTHGS